MAQKWCNTYDQWFQENEGQNKHAVSIIAYKILFPTRWPSRSLLLMKAFGFYGRFSEAMSFSKFATSVSKVIIDVPKISIVWLPRVKCLISCKTMDVRKTKTAWIKRSIHYVKSSAVLQSGEDRTVTQRNSSLPQSWLLIQKKQIWKWHCCQKNMLSQIKPPSSRITDLGVILLEKEFSTHLCTH